MRRARETFERSWERLLERPFARLVAHFASLLLQSGQESGASELNLSVGGLLALLAAPGGFVAIMLFEKYSSLLRWLRRRPQIDVYQASLPDKYFFIVFSMVITGVVVAIKWNRILPSRQDYDNLAPLPLRSRTVFFANLCAIMMLASVFALDVNAVSSVLFPGVVLSEKGTFPQLAAFIGVHATCVILASAFTFLACFAGMGILMSALPNAAFRSASLAVRLSIITSLMLMLCTSFAVLPAVREWPRHPHSPVRLLPPVWFLGLYQCMQGRGNAQMRAAAATGLEALAIVFVLALVFSVVSYRRYYMRIPESSDARRTTRRGGAGWIAELMDRVALRDPFQRACYHFTVRALLRSETHCILFGAFVGLGLVVASQLIIDAPAVSDRLPATDILAASLAVAYFVVIGLRFVFEIPAGVSGNWVYKLIVGAGEQETAAMARKVMLTFLVPGLVAPCLLAYSYAWGWRTGAIHAAYVLATSVLLMDIVLFRFRKIPFSCTMPGFQNHAIMLVFVYLLGFFLFAEGGAAMEREMMQQPLLFLGLPPLFALCYDVLRRIKRDTPEIDLRIRYEQDAVREVQTLNIG